MPINIHKYLVQGVPYGIPPKWKWAARWPCFWCQTLFSFRFILETCVSVYLDFLNFFFEFFKEFCMIWGIFHFFRKIKNLKNSKKNLFQKSKCTHVSSINLKGKEPDTKNIVTVLVYFCNNPYETPCIYDN